MNHQNIALTAIVLAICSLSVAAQDSNEPQLIKGTDQIIAPARVLTAPSGAGNSFRFEDAPMTDVVHVIMRDILKADYIVHSQLAGSLTLATKGDVSADLAVYLLESALQANGIVIVRDTRAYTTLAGPML